MQISEQITENHALFAWALPFVCIFFGWMLYFSIAKLGARWEIAIIQLIGVTYPIGEILQLSLLGPSILRWYLSDFGFVAAPAAFLLFLPRITWGTAFDWGRRLTLTAFMLGGTLELFFLQIQTEEIIPGAMVRGDVIDMVIFTAVYVLVVYLLNNLEKKIIAPQLIKDPKKKPRKKQLFRP
jgi:hypothetical protein